VTAPSVRMFGVDPHGLGGFSHVEDLGYHPVCDVDKPVLHLIRHLPATGSGPMCMSRSARSCLCVRLLSAATPELVVHLQGQPCRIRLSPFVG
jgi:hypothetical protein